MEKGLCSVTWGCLPYKASLLSSLKDVDALAHCIEQDSFNEQEFIHYIHQRKQDVKNFKIYKLKREKLCHSIYTFWLRK